MKNNDSIIDIKDYVAIDVDDPGDFNLPCSNEDILTVDGLGRMLKVNRSTIYQWVSARKVPFYKLANGSSLRFYRPEIVKWMLGSGRISR